MDILKVFNELYRQYGPQGWWPTAPRAARSGVKNGKRKTQKFLPPPLRLPLGQGEKATPQYHPGKYNRRLSEQEKFEIAIGAILTQNTAWRNVEKAIICLHQKGLMSPQTILAAPIGTLRKCIRSSGYYKQKTKKVKIFCRWLVREYGGELGKFFQPPLPLRERVGVRGKGDAHRPLSPALPLGGGREDVAVLRAELLSLWGVGPETADSILLYAGGFPVFVVDAYTRRLCGKYGVRFKKYEEYQKFFEEKMQRSHRPLTPTLSLKRGRGKLAAWYQEYHALIVKWGKEENLK